jgi:hypothetical protein
MVARLDARTTGSGATMAHGICGRWRLQWWRRAHEAAATERAARLSSARWGKAEGAARDGEGSFLGTGRGRERR